MNTLDLDELLQPISDDQPSGESLRYEGTYERIQAARREDNPNLPQGIWQTELKRANWREVEELALDALRTRSKDLQIAVWLMEAWMNMEGLAGVASGMEMIVALANAFWGDIHPVLDESDPEYRTAPLSWVNEKLSLRLKQIPLTRPDLGAEPVYTFADLETALQIDNLARRDQGLADAAIAEGKITSEQFNASVMATPRRYYIAESQHIASAIASLEELSTMLDERLGRNAPSLKRFRDMLEQIGQAVGDILRRRADEIDVEIPEPIIETGERSMTDETLGAEAPAIPQSEAPAIPSGPIRSRAEAYAMLAIVADYLMRTEPHSPTPYLLKRAVAWGNMPLGALLTELSENGDIASVYRLLGLQPQ